MWLNSAIESKRFPFQVGDPVRTTQLSDILLREYNHYVQAINYPTVARGSEKMRISPTPHHTEEMMDKFVTDMVHVWKQIGLPIKENKCGPVIDSYTIRMRRMELISCSSPLVCRNVRFARSRWCSTKKILRWRRRKTAGCDIAPKSNKQWPFNRHQS